MSELSIAIALPLLLLASSGVGWAVRRALHERNRSAATTDALRLVMSMLITFAALVLGLLTSSAKSEFDTQRRALQSFGIGLIELDQRLREYGPPADEPRAKLRAYTAAAIADSWPGEPAPPGDYPTPAQAGPNHDPRLESVALGALLVDVDKDIAVMAADTTLQRKLGAVLESRMSAVLQLRWQLVAGARATLSWPFMAMLMFWLILAFAMFGLTTDRSRLVLVVIALTAVSVSAAVTVIIDFGTPLGGVVHLSSEALRVALAHMDEPMLPR